MNVMAKAVSWVREASFFKRLVFSYIAGLLIVVLITSMICVDLVNTISDFSDKTAVNATAQFQATVENMVDAVQRIPTELSLDPTVASLATTQSKEFDASQRYSVINLTRQLKIYDLSNPYISGIFLYFPIQDYLVSDQGVYTLSLWQRINGQGEDLDPLLTEDREDLNTWISGTKTTLCVKLPTESGVNPPILCIFVDPVLKEFSGAQGTDLLSSFYAIAPNGEVLFSGGSMELPDRALVQELIERSSQQENVVTLQKNYIGYLSPSRNYSFYYMYFSPKNEFFGALLSSRRVVVFSLLLVLILGVVLSVFSARRTSRPIVRIANLMESGSGGETTLEAIEQSVISLVETKKEASKDTERYRTLQKEAILLKLLHQEIPNEAALKSQLTQMGITIPGDRFLAVTVTLAAAFPLTTVAQQFCAELRATTPNVIDLYFFQGAREIKIIAGGSAHALHVPAIKQGLQQTTQRLEETHHVHFRVAISEAHRSLFQLGLAYEEAQRVQEYSNFIGGNLVLAYGDLVAAQSGNENSLIFDIWFNKFANMLINHDFAAAKNIQKNIFQELSKHEYSIQFIKCKIFSFIDCTINVIGELDIVYTTQLWDDLRLSDRLLVCDNLATLEEVYSDIFSQLTQIVLDTAPPESRVERIMSMVRNGYTDPNFNVSTIADELGVSVAYVSQMFKEEFGSNLLEYIQKLRIDMAKKLLVEHPEMTVAQISDSCGFNSNITFTRVFKSFEGVPPGKYRSQSCKKL